ncbi:DUF4190 domain-containing protein [Protaetiibacter larvae]|uniref:DUF4190 domain-containing protein n=1 Tax=Protaetiibacter larvae TaxID=2592654 RepID=A0A5C1Y8L5_9MICO|nr:DUF4190 domain-containing protein [Protaetiibacter larvae]QEO09282.1 DUF4190 domain-containing protein [Protaetiibacter larvae]
MSDPVIPTADEPPVNPYVAANPAVAPPAPLAPPAPMPAPPAPGLVPYTVHGPAYASAGRTNTLAILSLVFSLGAILVSFAAIAGVVCGHLALAQIKARGERGSGLAIAGLVVGYLFIGIAIVGIAFWLWVLTTAGSLF